MRGKGRQPLSPPQHTVAPERQQRSGHPADILDYGMATSVSGFYDDFASDYHLLFEDWEESMMRQASAIGSILERVWSENWIYMKMRYFAAALSGRDNGS